MKYKNILHTLALFCVCILVLSAVSCELFGNPWDSYDSLVFSGEGLEAYTGKRGDISGSYDFGDVLIVENGKYEGKATTIKMTNNTLSTMYIDEIDFDNVEFDFYNHVSPAFPIMLKAKETTDLLAVGYYPQTRGPKDCRAVVTVRDSNYPQGRMVSFQLKGSGMCRLTLALGRSGGYKDKETDTGTAIGLSSDIKITSPMVVAEGGGHYLYYDTTEDSVVLEAEFTSILPKKFLKWAVEDRETTSLWYPEIDDDTSQKTTVKLNGHCTITANYFDPNVYVYPSAGYTDTYTSLSAAITAVKNAQTGSRTGSGWKENIVIFNDQSYGDGYLSGSLFGSKDKPLAIKGGYKGNPTSVEAREIDARTQYNATLSVEADACPEIEGINFKGSTPITIKSGAKPLINKCTFTGSGANAAMVIKASKPKVYNSIITGGTGGSSSTAIQMNGGISLDESAYIENCTISGGSSTLDTVSVRLLDNAYMKLNKNTINVGEATASYGQATGVRFDEISGEGRLVMLGNTIKGGKASASGGETFGVFLINYTRTQMRYNTIEVGEAASRSGAIFTSYGANLYANHNQFNLSTGSADYKYGMYNGNIVKVRQMTNNHFVTPDSGKWCYQYKYVGDTEISELDAFNEEHNAELTTWINGDIDDERNTSSDEPITLTVPSEDKCDWEDD